ncbi:MAG: MFS transporter [Dehalococcoidia bacterium]|nr:MFS transporter [Dehalococcoidia bacterium]
MLSLSRLRAVPALASPRSGRIFLGWWVVAAGLCLGGLATMLFMQAYGAYVVLLRQDFGWSKTLLSSGFSLGQAQAGVLGPVQGMLIDRLGPRFVARMGVLAMGAGFLLFSMLNSIPLFFLSTFLIFFGVHMSGFLTATVAAVNWFERKRARAIAMISLGVAAGGLLVPVTVLAMSTFGWRPTALGSGIAILLIGFPLAGLLYHRPENYGLRVDGDPPGQCFPGFATAMMETTSPPRSWHPAPAAISPSAKPSAPASSGSSPAAMARRCSSYRR